VRYLVDLALFGVLLEHLVEVIEGSRVVVVGARHLGELVQQRVVRVALVPQVQADQGRVVGPVARASREATSAKEGVRAGLSKEKSRVSWAHRMA
jgi:Ni,Fe-hydrogenase III large subunit